MWAIIRKSRQSVLVRAGGNNGAGNRNFPGICPVHPERNPATPVWKAYSGDRVIFRTMMPADKPRNVSLTIHGHLWREQPEDVLSRKIPIQGGISVGNRFDMELRDGAGCPGDYLYRSGSFAWDVESGMRGIFRVMKHSIRCRCKEICGRIFKGGK